MAEALSIVGLISNVLQFVELGSTCVRKCREVHTSSQGATAHNDELESHAQDVKRLAHSVNDALGNSLSSGASSGAQLQLRDFLSTWNAVADRLLVFLGEHKVKADAKYRSLQILKGVWRMEVGISSKEKIRLLQQGLDQVQSMILLCLNAIIRFVEFWL